MLGFLLSYIFMVVFISIISFTFKLIYLANQEIILIFDHYKTEIKRKHKNFLHAFFVFFGWMSHV